MVGLVVILLRTRCGYVMPVRVFLARKRKKWGFGAKPRDEYPADMVINMKLFPNFTKTLTDANRQPAKNYYLTACYCALCKFSVGFGGACTSRTGSTDSRILITYCMDSSFAGELSLRLYFRIPVGPKSWIGR